MSGVVVCVVVDVMVVVGCRKLRDICKLKWLQVDVVLVKVVVGRVDLL